MELVMFTNRNRIHGDYASFPGAIFYDTSTNAPYANDYTWVTDLSELSPFIQYGRIPVPGRNNVSDSVEGVWQGLKVIDGKIDINYFKGKGRKRRGNPSGHLLGDKIVRYKEAREKIYLPTYKFMFERKVKSETKELIYDLAMQGIVQFFFDVDENGEIGDLSSPLAHSSVLVDLINKHLQKLNQSSPEVSLK